jgi:hypothetical protein
VLKKVRKERQKRGFEKVLENWFTGFLNGTTIAGKGSVF